jgi:GGDEF domain-containing protein
MNELVSEVSWAIEALLEHLERVHADPASHATIAQLRQALGVALQTGKVSEIRPQMTAVLTDLFQRAEAQRRRALELTDKLRDRIALLEHSLPAVGRPTASEAPAVDACTGLPVRGEAELALRQAIEGGAARQRYAVIFYLHRMALINARFGESIGNQVILFSSQHIATTVTRATDLLFRWTGPAFLAIVERAESPLAVSAEVQRLISGPLSRFFETPSRSVYLPIKITAEVIRLFETNYAEVEERIQRFLLNAYRQAGLD